MTRSTTNLFRATKRKNKAAALPGMDMPVATKPGDALRDPLDYVPTPPEATRAFLAVEGARMREIGGAVWEPAVGGGHMAREIARAGFDVIGSDVADRGWPGVAIRSFYDYATPPARIVVTNPPYNEISARDGHGRWLRHIKALGVDYAAMLLNWDWIAARINGMDELHARLPPARVYVCCWKLDFSGGGSPRSETDGSCGTARIRATLC